MIKSSVSYQKIRAVDVSLNKSVVASDFYRAITSYKKISATNIIINRDSLNIRAIVSRQKLVAEVTFVDPKAEAYGNYSGKHIWLLGTANINNSVVATDDTIKAVTKVLSDPVVPLDVAVKTFNKNLSDSLSVTDSVFNTMKKNLSDGTAPTDEVTMLLQEDGTGAVDGAAINEAAVNNPKFKEYSA